jgi:hypothetical protein
MSREMLEVQSIDRGTQTPGQQYLVERYGISMVLASSGLSFYVLGFSMGPLICGYYYSVHLDRHLKHSGFIQGVIAILLNHQLSR